MRPTLRCAAVVAANTSRVPNALAKSVSDAVAFVPAHLVEGTRMEDAALISPGSELKGCGTECMSLFSHTPHEIFEGYSRQAWIDTRRQFCHLCQEPVSCSPGTHCGDRDHTNLHFFLLLYAAYPRRDFLAEAVAAGTAGQRAAKQQAMRMRDASPSLSTPSHGSPGRGQGSLEQALQALEQDAYLERRGEAGDHIAASRSNRKRQKPLWVSEKVLAGIRDVSPALHRFATDHRTTDQLHTVDDAHRRSELEALLFYLTHSPHQALPHALQGTSSSGFWVSGERMWKSTITGLISQIYPPLSAGMMTNFTQKCWGRSNEERLYDALRLARIKSYYGWGPYAGKERKSFFMRQIIYELLLAEVRPGLSETGKLLAAEAVRRLAFELIFLQSMDYMHRIQHVYKLLGNPSFAELRALRLL